MNGFPGLDTVKRVALLLRFPGAFILTVNPDHPQANEAHAAASDFQGYLEGCRALQQCQEKAREILGR